MVRCASIGLVFRDMEQSQSQSHRSHCKLQAISILARINLKQASPFGWLGWKLEGSSCKHSAFLQGSFSNKPHLLYGAVIETGRQHSLQDASPVCSMAIYLSIRHFVSRCHGWKGKSSQTFPSQKDCQPGLVNP